MAYPELQGLSNALAGLTADLSPRIIAVQGTDGRELSGFIWRTGLAVTAHEALEGEDEAGVLKSDGTILTAQIAGRDPTTDIALLKFDTGEFAEPAHAAIPAPGSLSVLVGRGEYSTLSSLVSISEVGGAWRSMRCGDIDARILLGLRLSTRAEGAGVFAPDGALIGMAVTGAGRRTLAIPAATIARAVATLEDKGYVPRGWLGVSLHPLGRDSGAIVVGIEPESPAAKGGFLVGDIITTWGDKEVHSVGDVADRLGSGMVGTNINLGVLRGGSALELEITIGERPRG
ncbi:S1C family serine protease [Devosia sp. ZB163]|uniref:S1C family serine protease n=1 Tax=Devosia sp. ZB163 TaxID=3025938 RepID=UPI0023606DF2|nr:S1C family serine protease [Devosia sp. ZB163]MDC9823497.1 S1C family serine protease [Devosia sp. ZB163]